MDSKLEGTWGFFFFLTQEYSAEGYYMIHKDKEGYFLLCTSYLFFLNKSDMLQTILKK